MSDDRFRQARRSLIDRHNQRQQQSDFDDDFGDDKTQLVDLGTMSPPGSGPGAGASGGKSMPSGRPQPGHAPPPTMEDDGATQMFELPESLSGGGHPASGGASHGSPSYGGASPGGPSQHGQSHGGPAPRNGASEAYAPTAALPSVGGGYGSGGYGSGGYGNASAGMGGHPAVSAAPPASGHDPYGYQSPSSPRNQVVVGGDEEGYEGHTQFVNLNDFANDPAAQFTPEQQAAGYDGNTQFVDVNALLGSAAAQMSSGGDIENDSVLRQSYQFGPESIQRGEFAMIFAYNALGQQIVLKRVWEGRPDQMSTPLRQRIAQLNNLKHPNLMAMNGLVASPSGLWVEMEHPTGTRLTALLQQNGPQPLEQVVAWIKQAGAVLKTVHANMLAYANMTTDALWIQPDGSVRIEPFDMLRFEDRGSLGTFGPQEMHRPLDQRQLSPSTDVYSLAAVMLAALTGLPLELNRIGTLDKGLAKHLQSAFAANPAERPQDIDAFLAGIEPKRGASLVGGAGGPDIKMLGAIAAVVMIAFGGFMYWKQQQDIRQHQMHQQQLAQQAAADAERQKRIEAAQAAAASADNQPGAVAIDPRLTITTSFAQNPEKEDTNAGAATASPEQLRELRERARAAMKEAETMPANRKMERYTPALEAVTQAIRMQEKPAEEDLQLLADLHSKKDVKEHVNGMRQRVDALAREGRIGQARIQYQRLTAIDPDARFLDYFTRHSNAQVEKVARSSQGD